MQKQLIVGTNTIGYAEKRNFVDLPFESYQVVKKQNLNKLPAHLYFKLTNRPHQYLWNTFSDLNYHKVNHFHFFNALSTGKTPWITTFETFLPRWGSSDSISKGLQLIAGNACKKIIAISECTAEIQKDIINTHSPELMDEITAKMQVIHPPQKLLINSYAEKTLDTNNLVLTLIGQQIFSKGGRETIDVISHLNKNGNNIILNLVSNLSSDNYASFTTEKDIEEITKSIEEKNQFIRHFNNISNQKVVELLISSHVCLLPTYADTYGYAVLEAQAAGTPVISTNIRALPEINNEEVGWLITVPKNNHGNALLKTEEQRSTLSASIKDQLLSILSDIITKPEHIQIKGKRCLERIRSQHSYLGVTKEIETIYDQITHN